MHVKLLVINKPATFNSFCIRLKNPFLLLCVPLVDPPATDQRQSGRGGRGRNNKDRQKFPQPATRSRFVIVPGSCVLSRLSTPPLVSPPASAGQQRTTPFSKSYSPQESPLTTWTECVVPRGRRRNPLERGNGGQEEKNSLAIRGRRREKGTRLTCDFRSGVSTGRPPIRQSMEEKLRFHWLSGFQKREKRGTDQVGNLS